MGTHYRIEGYIFKIFTEDQDFVIEERQAFERRIHGAKHIQETIDQNGFNDLFVVPEKWIYPLPEGASKTRTCILVCENMDLMSPLNNKNRWKSSRITHELLDKLHHLLKTAGLIDSVYIDNIPFTKKKKIAFIDTENFNAWPIPYHVLGKFLSKKNRRYWEALDLQTKVVDVIHNFYLR